MGSRPCEARNDLLNRWVRMKREERQLKIWEKPSDPGTVLTIGECERWRKRLCDEMNDKMSKLYNEPLPEAETRFLNDDMNRRLREIRRFELRIVELGGIDYTRVGIKTPNGDIVLSNHNQYQYFGRARTLPGVKELLEAEKQQRLEYNDLGKRANREELMEKVDSDYYGLYNDEDIVFEENRYEESLENHPDFTAEPDLTPSKIPTQRALIDAVEAITSEKALQVTVY